MMNQDDDNNPSNDIDNMEGAFKVLKVDPESSTSQTLVQQQNEEEDVKSPKQNQKKEGNEYVFPKVWTMEHARRLGGNLTTINKPTAGATHTQELPIGNHPLQLYSLATPNGEKVTILLEELLQAGIQDAEYDAWLINIQTGEQFGSDFVTINPNSKIPAMIDYAPNITNNSNNHNRNETHHTDTSKEDSFSTTTKSTTKIHLFESGSILVYLAEKFQKFIPPISNVVKRTECMNWLFWQMASAPYVGGGFGHFFKYAPTRMEYPIHRYTMEVKRQLDVLNQHLQHRTYMISSPSSSSSLDETEKETEEDDGWYTIADIAIWSWYGQLVPGTLYDGSAEFLNVEKEYPHVLRWAQRIHQRPAVQRGIMVNKCWGPLHQQLWERHDKTDFEINNEQAKQLRRQQQEKESH